MVKKYKPSEINWKFFTMLIVITLCCTFVPLFTTAIYFFLAYHALKGPKQTIQAFTIMFLILLGNPIFFKGGGEFRWFVFLAGFLRVLFDSFISSKNTKSPKPASIIIGFSILFISLSIFTSKMPLISILKILAFLMGTVSIFISFARTEYLRDYWAQWFSTFFVFLILASVSILPFGYGFERNGNGFQGILSHPQVFGSVAGIIGAWFTGLFLFENNRSRLQNFVGLISIFFIYFSLARTGAASYILGFLFSFISSILLGKSINWSSRFQLFLLFAFLSSIYFSVSLPKQVKEGLIEFVEKRATNEDAQGILEESRGHLIRDSYQNFLENKWVGIGLGVPSNYKDPKDNVEYLFNIPVSASVEKGFLPTAVIEEIGILGAIFTIVLLFNLFLPVIKLGSIAHIWLLFTSFLINGGEAVFFSLGGKGLLIWLMFGFGFSQSMSKKERKKKRFNKLFKTHAVS